MKNEYLVAGVVYLLSFFNMMVVHRIYRRASKTNKEIKHELQRADDIHKQFENDLKRKYSEDVKVEFMTENDIIAELSNAYDEIKHPSNIVRGMDYDDFINWLELGTIEDMKQARRVFAESNMEQHVRIIDGYLTNKNH